MPRTDWLSKQTSYTYDAKGQVKTTTDAVEGTTATYNYDDRDRLVSVTGLGSTIAYSYDQIGNMTAKTEGPNSYSSMTYGQNGEGPHALTAATYAGGEHTFEYDGRGNMEVERLNASPLHTYGYDAEGQVSSRNSSDAATYVYDAGGNLVKKGDTVYIGDIYEINSATQEVTKYYHANGQRIAMRKAGTLYYLTQDHLGGTALITDATAVVGRLRYYPYGTIRTQELGAGVTELPTDKLFTGQQKETDNGIYHYNARLYNADIGRFPQSDRYVSAYSPPTLNRYSYVGNNPTNFTDPTGNFAGACCGLGGPGDGGPAIGEDDGVDWAPIYQPLPSALCSFGVRKKSIQAVDFDSSPPLWTLSWETRIKCPFDATFISMTAAVGFIITVFDAPFPIVRPYGEGSFEAKFCYKFECRMSGKTDVLSTELNHINLCAEAEGSLGRMFYQCRGWMFRIDMSGRLVGGFYPFNILPIPPIKL